ncbi:tudor domain-containing protein 5 isoform X2 [Talpa occidentalis]|nr:tudor domain-containing protein 5 isoform X2 [Talpa occidentalis]XP_037362265.1 tudor domain-containing protein 5 isoform X2 [Talpa occidentalis]XP_037362266.1 tudor domain-containing protein 5 isoform X2 [Talpa occidentalis]XP_037362267.1 tudor domain-containing protein 5 isoform X2 [Talpa occidentalis]XP_037362269.1 tudor domain-containing protein 5 isoform X2 [Talpa occidentalis]XP_037362273.1 tudor domain-containing protein 5 isoform X2 [Talpa occidentalis]XP_037362274.1 tudor domain-c
MSEQEHIQECLRKEIRSLLISTKDGLTPQQLEKEYLLMVGNHLPLRILGYRSTMELVLDMPDVVSICPCWDGTVILKAIPDESTKGIASLVAKQRSSHKVRNSMQRGKAGVSSGPTSHPRVPYRGRVPPILPAVVKSELKDLLALSPVLLSDFEKAFAKRFGRSFQYVQYGFLSMFEVLNAASDVISVEQTRAGSLLMLRKNVTEEKQRGWPAGKTFAQPFRMKPGSYPTGSPVAKARFSQPTSDMEPLKPILNIEKTSKSNSEETSRMNHTEKLNQLENTFKSVIAQIGPGGTIDPELKHKIKSVVSKFPEGLLMSKLLGEFEVIFKEQLSPKQLGFLNVTELVGALSDILHVEFREGEQDLLVFDADMKTLPPDGAVSPGRNSCSVQTDKKIEAKACVSSPPRNSLSTATIKETTWDCPSKNHKDPEQKIYKKPNLVVKPLQLQGEMNKSQFNLAMANHDIPPDAVRDKKLYRLPPLDTSTLVGVFVEYIISPSQFYIRIYSRDSSELLEDMMIEMRRCYSNQLVSDRYVMSDCYIQPGHLCCVRISEDKWWYRVIIHRVLGKQEVEVFYPDFGNIGTVQKSSLRFLKCCYTKLPAQAIPCSLAWVRPVQEHWTAKAILQFQKLCGLKPLVGVVDEYVDEILNIFLCDTSSNEDIYFHHVLRTEGHAIVCRENVPSKGFRELNPLALYTKSSTGPEDIILTEMGCPSQQHYFNEDREISPQSKESELYNLEPLKDSELSSLKTQDKSCEENSEWSIPEPKDLKEENEDEIPTGMPCLESVTIGDDIWDENWLPLQAKMGNGGDAASHLFASSLGGKKQYSTCKEIPQKDWCFSTPKDVWDDSWQSSGLVNGMKEEVQKPEGVGAQENNTGSPGIPKQPNLKGSSDFSTLPKLEEFYVSLIQSQLLAEENQCERDDVQTPPKQIQLSTTAISSTTTMADSPEKHYGSVESSPESLKNEDFSSSHAITVFKGTSNETMDQLSLILSPEHQLSQKLYIPRSTATAALGAAARLATSRSLLHWCPSVKRKEA